MPPVSAWGWGRTFGGWVGAETKGLLGSQRLGSEVCRQSWKEEGQRVVTEGGGLQLPRGLPPRRAASLRLPGFRQGLDDSGPLEKKHLEPFYGPSLSLYEFTRTGPRAGTQMQGQARVRLVPWTREAGQWGGKCQAAGDGTGAQLQRTQARLDGQPRVRAASEVPTTMQNFLSLASGESASTKHLVPFSWSTSEARTQRISALGS
ncbi:hypothetical protein Cadr_000004869 [Camelus dromedarius]|uniref:Uncharacterized protein n=1 Tax=Camelus dromedarius TaxID=9838 RepID=A0A5N4ECA6_CAMDR|nr:hypothetical protein Cadr_000004869 [Camelus dromedarius]